jgi:hypothetical protein
MFLVVQQIKVANLTNPIDGYIPVPHLGERGVSSARTAVCPSNGRPTTLQAQCTYASGLTDTGTATCDGLQATTTYKCPTSPRCVWWDLNSKSWSDTGCRTLPSTNRRFAHCSCTHLTTFSAVADNVTISSLSVLSEGKKRRMPYQRSFRYLILTLIVYAAFVITAGVMRYTSAQETYTFLR